MLWQFTLILSIPIIIMRKITANAVWAFRTEKPFKRGNTEVKVSTTTEGNTTELFLHRNLIARKHPKTGVEITNAGYFTRTTKERLNGLVNVHIEQKNFEWFLNGELWNGDWVRVWRYRYV